MADGQITYYFVMSKVQKTVALAHGNLPLSAFGGDHGYNGLRENPGDASVRADHWSVDTVSNDTHVALKIMFTAQGFANLCYTRYCTGSRLHANSQQEGIF